MIEAGFAASSPGDLEAVTRIAKEVRGPVIASLARCVPNDIDQAWDALQHAERGRIHVFQSTSPIHMERMLRMTPDEVMASVVEGVKRARSYTDDVEFSPQDATRTDPDFLLAICRAAVDAGATTINVPDTVGYATPADFVALLTTVYDEVKQGRDDIIVSTHCHNDLGLAVANSLSAIARRRPSDRRRHQWHRRTGRQHLDRRGHHGGEDPSGPVRRGDRCRHDPDLRDVPSGVPPDRLPDPVQQGRRGTERLCARVRHPPARRASGPRNIRDHGPDRRRTIRLQIVLGKHSGRAGFADALEKLDIVLEDTDFQVAFDRFKQLADRKVEITEAEIRVICEDAPLSPNAAGAPRSDFMSPEGTRSLPKQWSPSRSTGRNRSSWVTATAWCTPPSPPSRAAFAVDAKLLDYRVVPVTSGADAMAEINVVVQIGDATTSGTIRRHRRGGRLGAGLRPGAQQAARSPRGLTSRDGPSGGTLATRDDGRNEMADYDLAVIAGDGVGPEVTSQAQKALDAAGERFDFNVDYTPYDLGGERYLRTGEMLPDSVLAELRDHQAILLGAVGTPEVPPGVLERGLLLKLRFAFDQYVNLRPVKLYPGVPSPVAGLTPNCSTW